ncbi:MAG TPA: asparagine synthase (glutamine-hydrolyzing) [Bacillota bacterium]|nr:asparagine synthase (glutamine-hydrolyzing) [Bacillota bacterium]
MCGIAVVISTNDSPEQVERKLDSMERVQRHRGPDDRGKYVKVIESRIVVGLGHQRLSIIDLTAAGHQPMISACGRYIIVFNGEVYNYLELARDLPVNPLTDGTGSDTAVVLAALMEWGPQALSRLNGMWALAFFDSEQGSLIVSRDRLGKKPLYYYSDGKQLLLSSESKAILVAAGRNFQLDKEIVGSYLALGMMNHEDRSYFQGINCVPPASYAEVNLLTDPLGTLRFQRYWLHPNERDEKPVESCPSPRDMWGLLVDSVKLRLRSDVPLGILLSGGVDSACILAAAKEIQKNDGEIYALSVISDDVTANEEPFIDIAAQGLKPNLFKVKIDLDPISLLEELPEVCWFNDQPIFGLWSVAHRRLMRKADELGITVLLTGQGSDEQLCGYNKFFYFYILDCLRGSRWRDAASTFLGALLKGTILPEFTLREAKRYIPYLQNRRLRFPIGSALNGMTLPSLGMKTDFQSREWEDLRRYSLPMILHSEDRMSMSVSKEVRVPFLDYRLVDFLGSIPPAYKLRNGWTKAILREAAINAIPEAIRLRKDKKGFNIPEDSWARHDFRLEFERCFKGDMLSYDAGIIDRKELASFYSSYLSGNKLIVSRDIFRIYCFEMWLKSFKDHIAVGKS